MTVIPSTSPAPKPIHVFMPPTSPAPTPGPATSSATQAPDTVNDSTPVPPTSSALPPALSPIYSPSSPTSTPPSGPPQSPHPIPTLRLEIRSLGHPGATAFLSSVTASTLLTTAVRNVQQHLYSSPPATTHCPPTRSVTVILRDISGVAYTTGTDLDPVHHKEIHFSLGYIASINPPSRLAHEITGVLTHELVHCYQHNAEGTCPGGLIEGIADWVRLCCRLEPPHWKRETTGKWDGGYQHTAYFLDYLERRFGEGTVRRINERLRGRKYEEKEFWTGLLGRPVEQLWGDYVDKVKQSQEKAETINEGTQT